MGTVGAVKEHTGLLKRRMGGTFKKWELRSYVKQGVFLQEFKKGADPNNSSPTLIIDMSTAEIVERPKEGFAIIIAGKGQEFLAPSPDEKAAWVQALSPAANLAKKKSNEACPAALIAPVRRRHMSVSAKNANAKKARKGLLEDIMTREHPYRVQVSLRVNLMEGDRLSVDPKIKCNPYCVITVDGDQRSISTTKMNTNKPFWSEEFFYDTNLTQSSENLTIYVNHFGESKDPRIGSVTIKLQDLTHGATVDSWYPIAPPPGVNKKDAGSLRVKVTFTLEKILPYSEYAELLELILDEDLVCAKALARVATTQLDEVAGTLVNIFAMNSRVQDFVRTLTTLEIQNTDSASIIFRGNTLSTKVIDMYMKMVGLEYLQQTLQSLVLEVMDDTESCEIDPTRLEKHDDPKKNVKKLQSYVERFFVAIDKSISFCPAEMKLVFSNIRDAVVAKFADGIEKYTAVSGFIFLRFFCPAILNPALFGIIPELPTGRPARTLTLIAKCMQNLANLVSFNSKEPYMKVVQDFLQEKIPIMENCITRFSMPEQLGPLDVADVDRRDLSRELSAVHRHFNDKIDALKLFATEEPNPKLTTLFGALHRLDERMAVYEKNPQTMPTQQAMDRMKRLSMLLEEQEYDEILTGYM